MARGLSTSVIMPPATGIPTFKVRLEVTADLQAIARLVVLLFCFWRSDEREGETSRAFVLAGVVEREQRVPKFKP
jgi:hypothetical protein